MAHVRVGPGWASLPAEHYINYNLEIRPALGTGFVPCGYKSVSIFFFDKYLAVFENDCRSRKICSIRIYAAIFNAPSTIPATICRGKDKGRWISHRLLKKKHGVCNESLL